MMDIYWVLGTPMTEHCDVCPIYAKRKWTWETLPTTPGAGDTPCIVSGRIGIYELVELNLVI